MGGADRDQRPDRPAAVRPSLSRTAAARRARTMARWQARCAPSGWEEERMAARRRRERDNVVELQRLVGSCGSPRPVQLSLASLAAKEQDQRQLLAALPRRPLAASLGSRRRAGPAGASGTRQRVVWEAAAEVWADTDRPGTAPDRGPSPKAGGGRPGGAGSDWLRGAGSDRPGGAGCGAAYDGAHAADGMRRSARQSGTCVLAAVWHRALAGWRPRAGLQGAPTGAPAWPWPLRPTAPRYGCAVRAGRLPGTRSVSAAL